jgi:guanylate kinase
MESPALTNQKEFEELLSRYQPSQELLEHLRNTRIGVIAGPAGSGKDTVRELLVTRYAEHYQKLLSETTRPPRPSEQDGREYWFKSEQEILEGLQKGIYLQGAIVHGQQVSVISGAALPPEDSHKIALPIWIVSTEMQMHVLKPDLRTVFLVPPSIDEMISRIQAGRSLSMDEIERRLQSSHAEFEAALNTERYYCVTSIQPDLTVQYVDAFLRTSSRDSDVDAAARYNISTILQQLNSR